MGDLRTEYKLAHFFIIYPIKTNKDSKNKMDFLCLTLRVWTADFSDSMMDYDLIEEDKSYTLQYMEHLLCFKTRTGRIKT
jgi:hypothetical protein